MFTQVYSAYVYTGLFCIIIMLILSEPEHVLCEVPQNMHYMYTEGSED